MKGFVILASEAVFSGGSCLQLYLPKCRPLLPSTYLKPSSLLHPLHLLGYLVFASQERQQFYGTSSQQVLGSSGTPARAD